MDNETKIDLNKPCYAVVEIFPPTIEQMKSEDYDINQSVTILGIFLTRHDAYKYVQYISSTRFIAIHETVFSPKIFSV